MNLEEFWEIIEIGKFSEEPEDELEQSLLKLDSHEIIEFQKIFDDLFYDADIWKLWGAGYIINGGCSDDGFMDFRYGLISKGKEVYETAIKNPDDLADFEFHEIDNESFAYVAQEVYESKTNKELEYETKGGYKETKGQNWDFDDDNENSIQLPKLSKKHLDCV